ncbi:hypothetical protein J2783_001727 [Chryseobacterium sediminis]|nr:hypothetical protein [Chryseobacterium sediminis]
MKKIYLEKSKQNIVESFNTIIVTAFFRRR